MDDLTIANDAAENLSTQDLVEHIEYCTMILPNETSSLKLAIAASTVK